jgi:hypothetical protein
MKKILAHLKGLWAALLPLYEVYNAAQSDGAITENEYSAIGKALVFFVGVWLIPNIGYVRAFIHHDRIDQTVVEPPGRHQIVDTDHDGVPDQAELATNDRAPLYDETRREHTDQWPRG